jgi:hypothetical protein
MNVDLRAVFKSLSPKIAARAMRTFDHATMVVVGTCWGAAILMTVFALYAVSLSVSTRRAAADAVVAEPVLPKIVRSPMNAHDIQPLVDRLQHLFPAISFSLGNDHLLTVAAGDGSKFREWITVLGYIDVLSPKYRWTIKELCVGKCSGGNLMRAVLTGESVSFEAP